MTKEELEKDYYADRPTEPYSEDDGPNDWANIAHYAEENLENAFKCIEEFEKENAELTADMAGLEEELSEKDRQIGELKNDMATAIPLLEKAECTSCIYTDSPCVRGDYPMKDGHCTHHKHFGDKITVLKVQNEQLTLKLDAIKWHYVKDGDYPKENEYIMIYSKLADNIAVGKRRCAGKIRKRSVYEWYFATYEGTCLKDKNVIAWKEIVLPEPLKETE